MSIFSELARSVPISLLPRVKPARAGFEPGTSGFEVKRSAVTPNWLGVEQTLTSTEKFELTFVRPVKDPSV